MRQLRAILREHMNQLVAEMICTQNLLAGVCPATVVLEICSDTDDRDRATREDPSRLQSSDTVQADDHGLRRTRFLGHKRIEDDAMIVGSAWTLLRMATLT